MVLKHWIPAFAGITTLKKHEIQNETFQILIMKLLRIYEIIKKFVVTTLGCTCPDEVFSDIALKDDPLIIDNVTKVEKECQ